MEKLTKDNVREILINEIKNGFPTLQKMADMQQVAISEEFIKEFYKKNFEREEQ